MTRHHRHPHGISDLRLAQRRALWLTLSVNAVYMVAEFVGGIVFNSLALLADAAHMLSDVAGLGIALIAQRLMRVPASARHTYGLQRAEVLGALINGLALIAVTAWIFTEAYRRVQDPADVAGGGVLAIASVGLLVNLGSAAVLGRARGRSLNMHAAFVHMLSDAAGSVGVVVAAGAVIVWNADWVDPAVSVVLGGLVLWATWGLLRDTVYVLMEATPRGMDVYEVEGALAADGRVESVHHLHLWNLASDTPALSAHVVLEGDLSLHDAQVHGNRLKEMLADRFGIEHATLELECHACEPPREAAG